MDKLNLWKCCYKDSSQDGSDNILLSRKIYISANKHEQTGLQGSAQGLPVHNVIVPWPKVTF
jgi:hypothetical protein